MIRIITGIVCLLYLNGFSQKDAVSVYNFNDGTTSDAVGGRHAKAYGIKFTKDRFGNRNSAVYLQGNGDSYINLGSHDALKNRQGTIALWIKVNQMIHKGSGVTHNPIIYTRAHGGEDFNEAFYMGYHLDLKCFNVNTSYSELAQVSVCPVDSNPIGQWHHLVLSFDDNFLWFYINGELENKVNKGFVSKYLEGDSILVGKRESIKNKRYLSACVDDIFFYDRVLSAAEVEALYNARDPNRLWVVLRWLALALSLCLLALLVWFFVNRRIRAAVKAEQMKNQLKNEWYEQENKVLAAQMNPHFIFNSLNTIQQFILVNENDKAQLYLSKFSRLIRELIESNTRDQVTLMDEIEIFKKYIEIEALRFNDVFEYNLELKGNIAPERVVIPRFLIQPLIENAIWHGLLPKKDGIKRLNISFELLDAATLCCVVDDNGVGRTLNVKKHRQKKKSLALNFIEKRLLLLSAMKGHRYNIVVLDKKDGNGLNAGVRVVVKMPVLNVNELCYEQ